MFFPRVSRKKLRTILYATAAFIIISTITIGIFAKNNWLPNTDSMTGKKTGWFGSELPKNASSSWNPLAPPLPTATPQLSKTSQRVTDAAGKRGQLGFGCYGGGCKW